MKKKKEKNEKIIYAQKVQQKRIWATAQLYCEKKKNCIARERNCIARWSAVG